ncbi:acyl-CoA dehydrogenase family protein, partial [Acinetobacter baumannii]
ADEEGCRIAGGAVTTAKGFRDAYAAFVENGWPARGGNPEFGGQGLPAVIQLLVNEMLCSADLSFSLFPGLTKGAIEAIESHASAAL